MTRIDGARCVRRRRDRDPSVLPAPQLAPGVCDLPRHRSGIPGEPRELRARRARHQPPVRPDALGTGRRPRLRGRPISRRVGAGTTGITEDDNGNAASVLIAVVSRRRRSWRSASWSSCSSRWQRLSSCFARAWPMITCPPGRIGLAIVLSTIVLTLLSAYAALVAVGGMIVLYRDSCEERGLPYSPARPRERIVSPMTAAIRRFVRPRARLRPGEMVEVRSLPEILATLDERGCLEGMPFMPEMAIYCGHRFPVHRRVDKVWEYAHGTGMRRVRDAVLLKTLRCDGQSHGGCQAACQLIWKEAWLRPPGRGCVEGFRRRASSRPRRMHAGLGRRRASLRLPDDGDRPGLDPALPT